MFIASKLLSFLTQPPAWVFLLALAGLLCRGRWRAWGPRLSSSALIVLALQGWEALPDALLRQLEAQYPAPPVNNALAQYRGIVLLGGALEPGYITQDHDQAALTGAAERMTVPVGLLQKQPHLRLLFTGGEGMLVSTGISEAARAKLFFDSLGVAQDRVVYESASRTTYDNAVFSARLPGVDPTQPWLLLTSGFHMPRAMASFRKAGWNVTAYPVDFRTGRDPIWTNYSLIRGATKWQLALHEWLGLIAYKLAGQA